MKVNRLFIVSLCLVVFVQFSANGQFVVDSVKYIPDTKRNAPSETLTKENNNTGLKVKKPFTEIRVYGGMAIGMMPLSRRRAEKAKIGRNPLTFSFFSGFQICDLFDLNLDATIANPNDNDEFSQQVMPINGGNSFSKESSVGLIMLSWSMGARTPYFTWKKDKKNGISGYIRYGQSKMKGVRSIDDCTNCRSEKFEFDSQNFVDIGIDLAFFKKYRNSARHVTLSRRLFEIGAAKSITQASFILSLGNKLPQ